VDDGQVLFGFGTQEELSATWSDEKSFVLMLKAPLKGRWLQVKTVS
jgi:hypothetical protein